jgi:hypothetical protein
MNKAFQTGRGKRFRQLKKKVEHMEGLPAGGYKEMSSVFVNQ